MAHIGITTINFQLKINKVDSLRHTVGLPPLAYMEKVYDVALPEGYDGKLSLRMYKK